MSDYLNRVLKSSTINLKWKDAFSKFKEGFDSGNLEIDGITGVEYKYNTNRLNVSFKEGPDLAIQILANPEAPGTMEMVLCYYHLTGRPNHTGGRAVLLTLSANSSNVRLSTMFGHCLLDTYNAYMERIEEGYPIVSSFQSATYGAAIFEKLVEFSASEYKE